MSDWQDFVDGAVRLGRLEGAAAVVDGKWVACEGVSLFFRPVGDKAGKTITMLSNADPEFVAQFPRDFVEPPAVVVEVKP